MPLIRIDHFPMNVKHLTTLADGRIAYTTSDDDGLPLQTVHVTNLSGSNRTSFTADVAGGLAGSPNDPEQLVLVGRDAITIVSPDSASRRGIFAPKPRRFKVTSQASEVDRTLAWSWDGKLLAFIGHGYEGDPNTHNKIIVLDKRLNRVNAITSKLAFRHVGWLPHNRAVSFYLEGKPDTEFFYLDGKIAPEENLTMLEFNSDRQTYTFTALSSQWDDQDTLVIYRMGYLPIGFQQYSIKDGVRYRWSRWSPDGQWLIYNDPLPNVFNICKMDTRDVREVDHPTVNFWDATPVWSKNSDHLLFVTTEGVFVLGSG